jgi:hypothetical protein
MDNTPFINRTPSAALVFGESVCLDDDGSCLGTTTVSEVGTFYWTDLAPDIVNPGQDEQGSVSV